MYPPVVQTFGREATVPVGIGSAGAEIDDLPSLPLRNEAVDGRPEKVAVPGLVLARDGAVFQGDRVVRRIRERGAHPLGGHAGQEVVAAEGGRAVDGGLRILEQRAQVLGGQNQDAAQSRHHAGGQ